ncbi:hypothetical protein [Bradyrhizobium jicamae]|nr:hypothetical protein [Bradyrhizobium jicamae]
MARNRCFFLGAAAGTITTTAGSSHNAAYAKAPICRLLTEI